MEEVAASGALCTDTHHTVLWTHACPETRRATFHATLAATFGTLALGPSAYIEAGAGKGFRSFVDLCDSPGCQHKGVSSVIDPIDPER